MNKIRFHLVLGIRSVRLAFLLLLIGSIHGAQAQCANAATPSCAIYSACFAKQCPCAGDPNEYFESYGLKYCTKFLDAQDLTPAGRAWRDSTLVCLQEAIVPKLDLSATPTCNCGAMKSTAFAAHVTCYTKKDASICDLPLSDIKSVRKVIAVSDAFSSDGWKQMAAVAKICESSAPDDGRRSIWKAIASILGLR